MLFGRHILELRSTDNAPVQSYSWGLDLSGTMDGAGGVGGLLWVTLHTVSGPAAGTHFAAYDGNGNVVALVSATTGNETSRYENGPFGEPIRVTGLAATLNPFRFSTKRTCNTSDLVLYEYRAYSPTLGRWLSRDPIEEWGDVPLYAFVGNALPNGWDSDGRFTYSIHKMITMVAGLAAGISPECVRKIAVASANTDIWHPFDHSYHYTRRVRGNKEEALQRSGDRIQEFLAKVCGLAQKGKCGQALKMLGRALHIVQDYYSHVYNGEPVSYSWIGRYPPDDDPNHRDHARDKDMSQAALAEIETRSILWQYKSCLACCCQGSESNK